MRPQPSALRSGWSSVRWLWLFSTAAGGKLRRSRRETHRNFHCFSTWAPPKGGKVMELFAHGRCPTTQAVHGWLSFQPIAIADRAFTAVPWSSTTTGHQQQVTKESARKRVQGREQLQQGAAATHPCPSQNAKAINAPAMTSLPPPIPHVAGASFLKAARRTPTPPARPAVYAARLGAARTASSFHAARTVCPTATAALRTAFAQGE